MLTVSSFADISKLESVSVSIVLSFLGVFSMVSVWSSCDRGGFSIRGSSASYSGVLSRFTVRSITSAGGGNTC